MDGMGLKLGNLLKPRKLLRNTVGFVIGKGNTPGTPESRRLGVDPNALSDRVVAQLTAPPSPSFNVGQGVLLAGAGLAMLLLLSPDRKKRR